MPNSLQKKIMYQIIPFLKKLRSPRLGEEPTLEEYLVSCLKLGLEYDYRMWQAQKKKEEENEEAEEEEVEAEKDGDAKPADS